MTAIYKSVVNITPTTVSSEEISRCDLVFPHSFFPV